MDTATVFSLCLPKWWLESHDSQFPLKAWLKLLRDAVPEFRERGILRYRAVYAKILWAHLLEIAYSEVLACLEILGNTFRVIC